MVEHLWKSDFPYVWDRFSLPSYCINQTQNTCVLKSAYSSDIFCHGMGPRLIKKRSVKSPKIIPAISQLNVKAICALAVNIFCSELVYWTKRDWACIANNSENHEAACNSLPSNTICMKPDCSFSLSFFSKHQRWMLAWGDFILGWGWGVCWGGQISYRLFEKWISLISIGNELVVKITDVEYSPWPAYISTQTKRRASLG